jgi:hypothetical protein
MPPPLEAVARAGDGSEVVRKMRDAHEELIVGEPLEDAPSRRGGHRRVVVADVAEVMGDACTGCKHTSPRRTTVPSSVSTTTTEADYSEALS